MKKENRRRRSAALVCGSMLALALAGGTLAYLTDTDSDVNVMTLGNVDIVQHEYERVVNEDGTYKTDIIDSQTTYVLRDFAQAKPLLPSALATNGPGWDYDPICVRMSQVNSHGSAQMFTTPNAVDKLVTVENTGKSDAYVRTIIAYEMGTLNTDEFDNVISMGSFMTDQGVWKVTDIGPVEIDGNNYFVAEYVYNGAAHDNLGGVHENGVLPAGDTTYPSLCQVYMRSNATNEDVEAIDGNNNGTYEILVFSQAVQTEGFANAETALDAAFGDITTTDHPWVDGVEIPTAVATADELAKALTNGESVYLTEDVTVTSTMTIPAGKKAELSLNGNNLSYAVDNSGASAIINNKGDLTISGSGTISFTASNPDLGTIPAYATNTITNTGTLTIEDGVTITNGSQGGASYAVDNHGVLVMNGGTLVGDRCALRVAKYNQDNVKFVMNGGVVKAQTPAWIQLPGSNASDAPSIDVIVNDGTFESTKASSADNNVLYTYSYGNSHKNTSITINGGEFLGGTLSIGSGYKGDAPALAINGGTFEYDVLQWLADDDSKVLYAANK